MNVLTMNAGSTSVKFALFESGQDDSLREGEISWANGKRGQAHLAVWQRNGEKDVSVVDVGDDEAAATCAIRAALGSDFKRADVGVVGHRIVHGGEQFRESVLIDKEAKDTIASLSHLAPLHNPPALKAIAAAEAAFAGVPQVAVFDTAFYRHLPPQAFLYPLPYDYYQRWGIRRFGFHGISYDYCSRRADELLNCDLAQLSLIICHLGGGCSATAIQKGAAIATTSGYSPLDGLMMGTRSGSLDPGILLALQRQHGLTIAQIEQALNSSSGLLGVSGISADLADIESAAERGNDRARLAFDMFADRVRSAIGGLAVTLGSVDALVFTDRVGENSPALRSAVCNGLEVLGLRLDRELNRNAHPDLDVAAAESRARILVIHTREELMIAREAVRVITTRRSATART
jgi:acetate kinase